MHYFPNSASRYNSRDYIYLPMIGYKSLQSQNTGEKFAIITLLVIVHIMQGLKFTTSPNLRLEASSGITRLTLVL